MIKYGLNGATTMPLNQAREIRLAAAAGFDLIEFRAQKIEQFLEAATLAELRQLLEAEGIKPLSINAIEQVNTRPSGGTNALQAECEKLASWANVLSCPYIVAVPGFLPEPLPEQEMVVRTVDSLASLVEIVAGHGVRLGFEFLGFANCSINSLRLAREVVRKLNSPAVGLVIDTFHFFLSAERFEFLKELGPGELLVFHVNDAEDHPRARLADEHRVLPGCGVIALEKMWAILHGQGVIDHVSLELFRPQYWERPPEEFLRDAMESLRQLFR